MNDTVPTKEDLKRKSQSELGALFRLAAEIAATETLPMRTRQAAFKTMLVVKACLHPPR
jgi:hypothetical protein